VWDAATGKTLATLVGHTGRMWTAEFNPDGTRIVTAADDKTTRIWDAATGRIVATLAGLEEEVDSAQFSPARASSRRLTTQPHRSPTIIPHTSGLSYVRTPGRHRNGLRISSATWRKCG